MKKRVIKIVTGKGSELKFETFSNDLDEIKKKAEAMVEKDEIIHTLEWSVFDAL